MFLSMLLQMLKVKLNIPPWLNPLIKASSNGKKEVDEVTAVAHTPQAAMDIDYYPV